MPEKIVVRQFVVEGSRAIRQSEIDQWLKDKCLKATKTEEKKEEKKEKCFLNRELSFVELWEAADAITQLYVERGYVTTGAYIPADRDIQNGIVPVKVVEGYLVAEDIRVRFVVPDKKADRGYRQAPRHRLKTSYIHSRLALVAKKPLNYQKLFEALQLLQINPLIQDVRATLSEGTRPGQSILNVDVVEARTMSASALLDNGRSPSVGSFRRQLQFEQRNLTGLGDGLFVSYSNTDGSNAGDLRYTLPVSPRNSTLSFNFGIAASKIVEEPFDFLDIRSKSSYAELEYRHPLIQTPNREFALGFTVSHQFSKATLIDGDIPFPVPGSDFEGKTRVTALRFSQEWTQRSDRTVFAVLSQFNIGLGLGATTNEEPPDGRFFAWRGSVQWIRLLGPDTPLLLRGNVQLADRALVPLEQFGLGGPQSVRGYRQDFNLSDNGLFGSAEVRIPVLRFPKINGLLQLTPFVDLGTGWNNSGFDDPDPQTLASVGLGLRFDMGDRLSARFEWGAPLVSSDRDKNTLQERGLYFSLIYRFL